MSLFDKKSNKQAIQNLTVKGSLAFSQGDYDEASKCFREILSLDSNNVPALSNLGGVLSKQGNFTEGLVYLQRATEIKPLNSEVFRNYAIVLKKTGYLQDALDALTSALIIDSNNAAARYVLAEVLLELNKKEEAIMQLKAVASGYSKATIYAIEKLKSLNEDY